MSDLIDLLQMWQNDGLTPLGMVKGYAEVFLEGKLGALTDKQYKAVEVINRCCHEAMQRWYDLSEYFSLHCPDEGIGSPAKISDEGIRYLQEHVFEKALESLHTIKQHASRFLKDELGNLTDEQRKAVGVIHRCCEVATERWQQPITYFNRSESP